MFSASLAWFFSMRAALQRGPYFRRIGSSALETTRIRPRIVNIHPVPTRWMPGSIATVAAALLSYASICGNKFTVVLILTQSSNEEGYW